MIRKLVWILVGLFVYYWPTQLAIPPAPPEASKRVVEAIHTGEQCRATALFYEARGEPVEGQRAVLEVIENRKKHRKLSWCQVIKQKYQFSWYPKLPIKEYNAGLRKLYRKVSMHPQVLNDERFQYFYSGNAPKWAMNMECRRIGGHSFCMVNKTRREDET